MAFFFALSAGLCYAIASVFQHKVAAAAPAHLSLRPALILEVIRHPIWIFGIALDFGAYFLEAAALANGSILLVQTLLVSGLLFALPLSAIGSPFKPRKRDWMAAAAVAIGIAVFLAVGEPHGGNPHATAFEWISAFGFCVAIMAAMILTTRRAASHYRAMGLAIATGAGYACTAALTKQVVESLSENSFAGLFVHWPIYALAAFAVTGLVLNQSAFNAGHLAASLPALAVTTPMLSAFLGISLFEEQLAAHGVLQYSVCALAVAVMVVGVVRLARSPFVAVPPELSHPPITPAAP